MRKKFSTEAKVGVFVILAIALLAYITVDVSQLGWTPGGTYKIYTLMDNAEGVTVKTPVQVAGIPVGTVSGIALTPDRKARVEIELRKDVKLGDDVTAEIRTRGVLGDTYIELFPGRADAQEIAPGGVVGRVKQPADYQQLVRDLSVMTADMKEVTAALKTYTVSEHSYTAEILKSTQVLTANLATFTNTNAANMNAIVNNMRILTDQLRGFSQNSTPEIEASLKRIAEITEKVNSGQGTVGKLLNDPQTAEKTNELLDNINGLTEGIRRIETEVNYHMEYLGSTKDVKNYVGLRFQPRPDKFFLFEVVHDPAPSPSKSTQITSVTTSGGATSTITTETEDFHKVRFSAELGKKFHDVTVRGGLIESTGGFGIDYTKGPVAVQFSAFDFGADRPHLKLLSQLNVTRSLFLVGGLDDFINPQHGLDWFMGAGVRFTDEDIKSLLGTASLAK
ncbi:MAG: MlaD family protein [Deltaproteobacteria bacterium]|nr:MlaD family protein [Deltaproteobacteria bacterium]